MTTNGNCPNCTALAAEAIENWMASSDGPPVSIITESELRALKDAMGHVWQKAIIASAAEAAALREAADTLVERLAQVNLRASEETALGAAIQYGPEALAVREILDNPSPAVAALEQQLAPMPCGHPGACVVSADEGTAYCRWCEDVAQLQGQLEQLEAIDEILDSISSLLTAAGITDGEIDSKGTWPLSEEARVRIALQRLERAGALVPDWIDLADIAQWGERWITTTRSSHPDLPLWQGRCQRMRTLAARIEAAQRQGQEEANDRIYCNQSE